MNFASKAQGEIFGLALVFVLLIFGVVIYAQFKALNPEFNEDSITTTKYKILSENTISSLKKISTPCSVQTGKNTLSDLMRYCMEFSKSNEDDPMLACNPDGSGERQIPVCEYSFSILNQSIQSLFSSNAEGIGNFPFSLHMYNEELEHEMWHNRVITNINETNTLYSQILNLPLLISSHEVTSISINRSKPNYYLFQGFSRVNAGKDELSSGRRSIEFELNIYYR